MASKKIFVVDDDEMMCEMLRIHLSENPRLDVYIYNTGEECVKNLHLEPEVIILDYELNTVVPDAEDGLKILKKIKAIEKDTCVIMLSSQTHYGRATQTIMKGAIEYVVKDDNAFSNIDKILNSLN